MNSNRPFTIACFGDSITGPVPGIEYRDRFLKWPDLLQLLLETGESDVPVNVRNYGKAGDPSWGLLTRIGGHLDESKPNLAVMLIGGNNFGHGTNPVEAADRLKADLTAIHDQILDRNIRLLLLSYFEPRAENMEKVWTHLNAGNKTVAALASERGIPLLDLAPAFRSAAEKYPLHTLLSPIDGVHLNPLGEGILAKAVCQKLRELDWLP